MLFGSHPEFGSGLALDDVGLAATMLLNAVEWQVAVRRGTPLLEQAGDMLGSALDRADWFCPATNGYEHMRTSPYHLVAGSYLAAIGSTAGAALLRRAFG